MPLGATPVTPGAQWTWWADRVRGERTAVRAHETSIVPHWLARDLVVRSPDADPMGASMDGFELTGIKT